MNVRVVDLTFVVVGFSRFSVTRACSLTHSTMAHAESLPLNVLTLIEHPAHIVNVENAVVSLGGEQAVASALGTNDELELNLRFGAPFSHPIPSRQSNVKVRTSDLLVHQMKYPSLSTEHVRCEVVDVRTRDRGKAHGLGQ